jgi:hypothetical protein
LLGWRDACLIEGVFLFPRRHMFLESSHTPNLELKS